MSALDQVSHSEDPMISALAKSATERESSSTRWKPAATLSVAESIIDFNLAVGCQHGTSGLGYGLQNQKLRPNSLPRQRRATISATIQSQEADLRISDLQIRSLSGVPQMG